MRERKLGSRPALTILNYHRVVEPGAAAGLDGHMISASPEGFEWQMAFLRQHFELLTPEEIVTRLALGHALPSNAALVTFDDGYRDNFEQAYPILQRRGIPAIVFLITGLIDTMGRMWWDEAAALVFATPLEWAKIPGVGELSLRTREERLWACERLRRFLTPLTEESRQEMLEVLQRELKGGPCDSGERLFLTWNEVREMRWGGVGFGAHTHTHPILTHMHKERAAWEVAVSKKIVERELGQPVQWFAYPGGRRGNFDEHTQEMLKRQGIKLALTLLYGSNPPGQLDLLALRRIHIDSDDRWVFAAKASGALERIASRSKILRDQVDGE